MGERKKRVQFKCTTCGKLFWENSSQARKRLLNKHPEVQNCSRECYAEYRKKKESSGGISIRSTKT